MLAIEYSLYLSFLSIFIKWESFWRAQYIFRNKSDISETRVFEWIGASWTKRQKHDYCSCVKHGSVKCVLWVVRPCHSVITCHWPGYFLLKEKKGSSVIEMAGLSSAKLRIGEEYAKPGFNTIQAEQICHMLSNENSNWIIVFKFSLWYQKCVVTCKCKLDYIFIWIKSPMDFHTNSPLGLFLTPPAGNDMPKMNRLYLKN